MKWLMHKLGGGNLLDSIAAGAVIAAVGLVGLHLAGVL